MYKHLYSEVSNLKGHRVLCIGDMMLDRFVYGSVSRISPEAPIPVFHEGKTDVTLGGGGNVVRNIVALGGIVDTVALVGNDEAGLTLTEILADLPHTTPYILTDDTRPTIIKTRFVSGGQQLLRSDREDVTPLSSSMEDEVLIRTRTALEDCDIVILSDYAKGLLTDRIIQDIISLAKEKGKPILIDTKGRDFTRYNGATILTPNRKELSEATNRPICSIEEAEEAARLLIDSCSIQGVLAKLGGDGVCLVMKGKKAKQFKADSREVYDVSGAGDTVVATMALAIAGGLSFEDSAALSNLAGSVVVTKLGTATVSQEELKSEIMHGQTRLNKGKIMSLSETEELAKRARMEGKKIGFTNGLFDHLTPDHLRTIQGAKKACDFLIVGVNSDSSIQKQKGNSKPINSEEERLTLLSALSDVDAAVLFDEETPYDIIKKLKPDFLIKGSNYKKEEIIGHDLLSEWGGEALLIE